MSLIGVSEKMEQARIIEQENFEQTLLPKLEGLFPDLKELRTELSWQFAKNSREGLEQHSISAREFFTEPIFYYIHESKLTAQDVSVVYLENELVKVRVASAVWLPVFENNCCEIIKEVQVMRKFGLGGTYSRRFLLNTLQIHFNNNLTIKPIIDNRFLEVPVDEIN